MSEPIKAGDLVMIVKPSQCTGLPDGVGTPFVVDSVVAKENVHGRCLNCGQSHRTSQFYASDGEVLWPFARLKRIPPLNELDAIKRNEELTA